MASKKPAKKASLPKGFKALGGFGENWPGDLKAGAELIGELIGIDKTKQSRKGEKKPVTVRIARIETKEGKTYSVWESWGTRPLMDLPVGSQVYIRFDGMGKAKKGQSPPRLYTLASNAK